MRIILLILATLFFAVTGTAQDTCTRHSEPTGGYSMCVPETWTVESRENMPYKILIAPRAQRFTANINFRTDTLPAQYTLAGYVETSVKRILADTEKLGATSIKVVSSGDFVTAGRSKGVKTTYVVEFKGIMLRTYQYIFAGKDGKKIFIVTCTSLDADDTSINLLFDRTVKTFVMD